MDIKVINGILCWKSKYQDEYTPFTRQGLTMLIRAYESEIQQGIDIWKEIKYQEDLTVKNKELIQALACQFTIWIEALRESFPISKSLQHVEDFGFDIGSINLN